LRLLVLDIIHDFRNGLDSILVSFKVFLFRDLKARSPVTSEFERGNLSVLF